MSSNTFTFNPTMSLYIARVYATTSKSFIIKVFEENIRFGKIRSIHMQKIPGSKHNYTAIIHFESWNETIVTTNFQTRIFKQGFARVVHNDPWYWIVMENNSQIVHPVQDTTEDTTEATATATTEEEGEIDTKIKYKYFFEMVNGIVNNVNNINNIQTPVINN